VGKGTNEHLQPRWARLNRVKTDLARLRTTLGEDVIVDGLGQPYDVGSHHNLHKDEHVPDLLAFPPGTDLTKTKAYLRGEIILQDKASCFPAHLLLGDALAHEVGDVLDGCAAPGNKSTHLASILSSQLVSGGDDTRTIFACERDPTRSKILQTMVSKAGCDGLVTVLARQDFLALDPYDTKFEHVTHLLLDPSCSGSGIVGREDMPKLALPDDPKPVKQAPQQNGASKSKKRKRETEALPEKLPSSIIDLTSPEVVEEEKDTDASAARLEKLSNLQSKIVEHALRFPAAKCVSYSTCSIHCEENEDVVARILASKPAQAGGWRLMLRHEQAKGMREWKGRGIASEDGARTGKSLTDEEREACIRCTPRDAEGTMGFFVCAFVRKSDGERGNGGAGEAEYVVDTKSWDGFDDED